MSRHIDEPRYYVNQQLMDEFNQLMICLKTHLFDLGDPSFKERHPKPTSEQLDQITTNIMRVLSENSQPLRKSHPLMKDVNGDYFVDVFHDKPLDVDMSNMNNLVSEYHKWKDKK